MPSSIISQMLNANNSSLKLTPYFSTSILVQTSLPNITGGSITQSYMYLYFYFSCGNTVILTLVALFNSPLALVPYTALLLIMFSLVPPWHQAVANHWNFLTSSITLLQILWFVTKVFVIIMFKILIDYFPVPFPAYSFFSHSCLSSTETSSCKGFSDVIFFVNHSFPNTPCISLLPVMCFDLALIFHGHDPLTQYVLSIYSTVFLGQCESVERLRSPGSQVPSPHKTVTKERDWMETHQQSIVQWLHTPINMHGILATWISVAHLCWYCSGWITTSWGWQPCLPGVSLGNAHTLFQRSKTDQSSGTFNKTHPPLWETWFQWYSVLWDNQFHWSLRSVLHLSIFGCPALWSAKAFPGPPLYLCFILLSQVHFPSSNIILMHSDFLWCIITLTCGLWFPVLNELASAKTRKPHVYVCLAVLRWWLSPSEGSNPTSAEGKQCPVAPSGTRFSFLQWVWLPNQSMGGPHCQ